MMHHVSQYIMIQYAYRYCKLSIDAINKLIIMSINKNAVCNRVLLNLI